MIVLGLGGGCHWCTEAVFNSLTQAFNIEQGWISSLGEASTFSEAIRLQCHTKDLESLIHIHLKTHSSQNNHQFRDKYRSAVYYSEECDKPLFENALASFDKKIITKVLPLNAFKLNSEKYLNYYEKNKGNQFCETYIEPKLKLISKSSL